MTATNEKLSESEIRYKFLIESVPDVIAELGLDGTISFVSPQVYDMLGYYPDEMIRKNIIKFIHPDDVPSVTKAIKKAIKVKEVIFPKLRLKHKEGNFILVFAKGKLIKLNDKAVLIGIIKDITKFDETEKKLEESQDIFEQLNEVFLKFKEDPIFNLQLLINAAGLLLNADCALFNVLKTVNGRDVLESLVVYKEPPDFIRESDAKGHICTDIIRDNPDDVVIIKNLDKTDYRKTDENVRKYDLKQYVSYVVRFNNIPITTFCVVYTENREMSNNDITILKILAKSASTEFARWKALNFLQESEEKYRSLVEDAQEGVWALDENENTIFVNVSICEMLGYTKNEMMGKNVDSLIPDSMKERIKSNRIRREKGIKETYDLELLKKDGTIIYTNVKAAPIMSESRGYKGSFAYITDITTQKHAEDTLRESEEKFRTISEQSLLGILISQGDEYKYANQAVADMFGYTVEELLNTPKEGFMNYIHPEDREFVREQATKKQKGMKDVITSYPYRGLTKSGETIWLQNYSRTITFEGKFADLITMMNITEQRKAQQDLIESEEKYRTVSDYSMVGISIIQDMQFKYVNQKFADSLGYTIEELLNLKPNVLFASLIHPDDLEWAIDISKKYPKGASYPAADQIELHCLKKGGDSIWLELFARSIQFEGRPAVMNASIDITERRKSQQNLEASEEKYRILFNEAPFGIVIFNPDGTILDSNIAIERITNYKKAELIGRNFKEIGLYYDPTDASVEERQALVSQGKDLGVREIQLYKKNRELFWASSNVSIIKLGKETVVQAIIQDITKRKRAERKLKESEEKYRSLANELESILDHLPLIIAHKDDKNTLLRVNKYYADSHNLKKEDMEGKSAFEFYPHDLAQAYLDDDLEVIKSGKPKLNYIELWESKDGSRWVNTSKIPYIDEEGNIKGIIAIVNDITEKKEIEEMKTYLLTRFSHEFKTPLVSIKGFSDLLLTEYIDKLDGKMVSFLKKIKEGADKLTILVNTFIQSSQLGEKLTRLKIDKENLSDLIKLGVSEMQGLIHLRKHTINMDIPDKIIGVFDKEQIYSVITNLLLNAIKYTPPGGKISIYSKIEEGEIFFSIKDNGIGLTEEDKRHLFISFGKIERYGNGWDIVTEGMGVGLYLSKEMISLHGGKIWAESEGKNKGSTFSFSLPMTNN